MNVLIIEDDPQKAERIEQALKEILRQNDIDVCRSYQSGLLHLESMPVDLIILDMSLPTLDPHPDRRQGRPRPLGGFDLMRKIRRSKLHIKIIIVTALENFGPPSHQFTLEELRGRCKEEFPYIFVEAIYYSQSKNDWRIELSARVKELIC